jgi:hypothetical protein
MVKKFGKFQVNFNEAYVRLKVGKGKNEDDYEYLVSKEKYGSREKAVMACRLFEFSYNISADNTKRQIKDILGL